jgi:protein phosphatase
MAPHDDTDTVIYPAVSTERPRPYSSLVQVDLGAVSDTGKVRSRNEDHYLACRVGRWLETLLTNLPEGDLPARFEEVGYILAVADGMGGRAGGDVASKSALSVAINLLLHQSRWHQRVFPEHAGEVLDEMADHVRAVDHVLTEQAQADPELQGMGTTLTGAYSTGAELFLAHVGDSRAYLFRDDRLVQLTRDQTYAQVLADAGILRPEEVAGHHLRHVLMQAVGGSAGQLVVQVEHLRLADGDRLLLCSDGLTEMVADDRIADELRRTAASADACRALVDLALEAGGRDNVTVLLARYAIPPEQT